VVWHHSLPLMNSFNKTEAAVFSCRLCFLRAFPFISLIVLLDLEMLILSTECLAWIYNYIVGNIATTHLLFSAGVLCISDDGSGQFAF